MEHHAQQRNPLPHQPLERDTSLSSGSGPAPRRAARRTAARRLAAGSLALACILPSSMVGAGAAGP
ncbi:MAG: hypothetical protein LBE67_02880 [Kocuria palustris]|nr:hypothetical protein [Kocuria palustris]